MASGTKQNAAHAGKGSKGGKGGKGKEAIGAAVDAALGAVPPVPATTLANATGEAQAQGIKSALGASYLNVAAAALVSADGNFGTAAALIGDAVRPALVLIDAVRPILKSPAPSAAFTDGNNRGARVGDLWAAKLGLGRYFRDASKADIKAARAALKEGY